MRQLNYCWRVFATGFSFALFGIGGLILSVTLMPLITWLNPDVHQRQRKARRVVQQTFRFFLRVMELLGVCNVEIHQKERFNQAKGKLVMANHPSLIDVVVLISLLPDADCVVKSRLLSNPFMKHVIRATGYIANDNPEAVIDCCEASLKRGNNLIIFPEGTRTTPGQPFKLQRGAANIALRAHADVLIAIISVTPTTLTKNSPWYKIPEKKFKFNVKIKDNAPLPLSGQTISKESRRYTRELTDYFSKEVYDNE